MKDHVQVFLNLSNALMSTLFYKEFSQYLTRDQALNRFKYVDLSLNPPTSLNQPVTRLTQALFEQGGIVSPIRFHFYLMKIQALYSVTQDFDDVRLQQSYNYLDICEFYYLFRSTVNGILRGLTGDSPVSRERVHEQLEQLLTRFTVLLG